MRSIFKASVLAATLGGCVASAGVGYHAAVVTPAPVAVVETAPPPRATVEVAPAPVEAPPPEPVYVEPSPTVEVAYVEPTAYVYINPQVQVIENYDYPVFFSNGMYWRNEGGVWYSSSYHDRGWVTTVEVPVHIRTIERPEVYVHYHANVNARVGQPGYRYHPAAPIRHTAPPPRYIEAPGHPVGHGPVEHGREPVRTPPQHVEPQHPVTTQHAPPPPPPASPAHAGGQPGERGMEPGHPAHGNPPPPPPHGPASAPPAPPPAKHSPPPPKKKKD